MQAFHCNAESSNNNVLASWNFRSNEGRSTDMLQSRRHVEDSTAQMLLYHRELYITPLVFKASQCCWKVRRRRLKESDLTFWFVEGLVD